MACSYYQTFPNLSSASAVVDDIQIGLANEKLQCIENCKFNLTFSDPEYNNCVTDCKNLGRECSNCLASSNDVNVQANCGIFTDSSSWTSTENILYIIFSILALLSLSLGIAGAVKALYVTPMAKGGRFDAGVASAVGAALFPIFPIGLVAGPIALYRSK